jgi:hypothetical protein
MLNLHQLKTRKMKKLFILLCCSMATMTYAQEQTSQTPCLQDSHHNIIGYMINGTLSDASGNIIISNKSEHGQQTIFDKNNKVIGHLVNWQEIRNDKNQLLGTIVPHENGYYSITDKNGKTIGYVNAAGEIQDANHITIAYEMHTEPGWVAPYVFFFKN